MSNEVHILSGCSGSGKSTEVERIMKDNTVLSRLSNGVTVCSADHYFLYNRKDDYAGNPISYEEYRFNPKLLGEAHGACLKRYIEAVQRGQLIIIVDNTNTTVEEIAPYVAVANAYGVGKVFLTTLMVDPIVAHARNKHNVPLAVIQGQQARIDSRRLPGHWNVRASLVYPV